MEEDKKDKNQPTELPMNASNMSRRNFLRAAGIGAAALQFMPSRMILEPLPVATETAISTAPLYDLSKFDFIPFNFEFAKLKAFNGLTKSVAHNIREELLNSNDLSSIKQYLSEERIGFNASLDELKIAASQFADYEKAIFNNAPDSVIIDRITNFYKENPGYLPAVYNPERNPEYIQKVIDTALSIKNDTYTEKYFETMLDTWKELELFAEQRIISLENNIEEIKKSFSESMEAWGAYVEMDEQMGYGTRSPRIKIDKPFLHDTDTNNAMKEINDFINGDTKSNIPALFGEDLTSVKLSNSLLLKINYDSPAAEQIIDFLKTFTREKPQEISFY